MGVFFRSNKDLCALWPVDLKLVHIDCNPDDTLVHFQGQHVSICELDYNILCVEIHNTPKLLGCVLEVGDFCLVKDVLSSRWFRGRIQNKSRHTLEVFLLDHGNILTVSPEYLARISDDLMVLPPKIVCGFLANVLPVQERWDSASGKYFSSLIGSHVKGYIHGLLPHKVLILEVPEINKELFRLNLCRHIDTETFLFLVEMLIEIPVQQNSQPVPDLLLEKQIVQELSFKSSNLCGIENILSFSRPKLDVGQKETVRLTAAVNPGLFYCQLSCMVNDLKVMSDELALAFESKISIIRNNPDESMGLLCAIKGKDQKWHRGFVQCLPVNSQVKVVFIDCGYCESVNVENIHQLLLKFLRMPIGTFPCSLAVNDKDLKNQQMSILKQGLLGKEVNMTVNGFSREDNVYLVTLSSVVKQTSTNSDPKTINGECQSIKCANESQNIKALMNSVSEGLVEGSVFEGYIEHVQSLNDFWMRTADRNANFEVMMDNLTEYLRQIKLDDEILEHPVPGTLCCAMYEKDLHYYRALVLDTLEHGAEVFFIDFGNTEKVPSWLIKKLPEEFALEPRFALGCSLAHVAPVVSDVWTKTEIDFFRRATKNKVLTTRIVQRWKDTLIVELFEKGAEKKESIAELMSRENMVEYWEYGKTKTTKKMATERRTMKLNTQNVMSSLEKVIETPASEEKSNLTTVDTFKTQNLQPGAKITVQCTNVISPSNFWCQNMKYKFDLVDLNKRLQAFYEVNSPPLMPNATCCSVKFPQYNQWYRGFITERKNSEVKLIIVDYGIVVEQKLENLRAIMPEFLSLEVQAFPCSLYNLIEPIEGTVWPEEASILFKKFLSVRPLNLTCKIYSQLSVKDKGLRNVVDLFTPVQRVTSYLVEKGVASKIKCPKKLVPAVFPSSFVYSSENIKAGDIELVYCTHVVSPWEIYLQLDRNTDIIEKLMERTAKESDELLNTRHPGQIGTVCLAKYFDDGLWYRSLVRPAKSSRHLNVFFVDFGNKQVVELENVLPIPLEAIDLLFTPMQALRCRLAGVLEDIDLSEVNSWLEEVVYNKPLRSEFVSVDESGRFICRLFDGEMNINEKIKELFEVRTQKNESNGATEKSSKLSKDMMASEGRVVQKALDRHKSMWGRKQPCQKTSPKISSQPHNQKVSFNSGVVTSILPQIKKKNHNTTLKKTSVVIPVLSDLPGLNLTPGFKDVGFISYSDSSDNFYIQMEKDEPQILKMVEELNGKDFLGSMKPINLKVKVGDLVVAVYEEDHALYRAVITGVASSSTPTVEFIDYGNTASIKKQKFYFLPSRFLSQSRLSIQCTLSKPCNYKDVQSFTKEAQNNPLMIEFVQSFGNLWEVRVELLGPLLEVTEKGSIELSVSDQDKLALNEHDQMNSACEKLDSRKPEMMESKEQLKVFVLSTNDEVVQRKKLRGRRSNNLSTVHPKLHDPLKATDYGIIKVPALIQATPVLNRELVVENSELATADLKEPQNPPIPFEIGTKDKVVQLRTSRKTRRSRSRRSYNNKKPDMQIPKWSSSDRFVMTAPKNLRTQLKVMDDITLNKSDHVQRMFLAPIKTNHEYSGFAAALTTPSEFCILLEASFQTLSAISNILHSLPEELPALPESHLIPGAGCLIKLGEEKKFCRSEIIQFDGTSVILNMVDYGHCERLPCESAYKLKKLPKELASLPKLTCSCILRGVKPADGQLWSDEAVTFFQECIDKKPLQIFFKQQVSKLQWEVDIFVEDKNVTKRLCEAGHASYLDAMLGIRFQQSLQKADLADDVSEQSWSKTAEDALTRFRNKTSPDCRRETEDDADVHQSGHRMCDDCPSSMKCK